MDRPVVATARETPMSLQEPAARRHRPSALIGSAAGHVAATHERSSVADLFEQYEALVDARGSDEEKHALAQRICALLAAREWSDRGSQQRVTRAASGACGRLDDGDCRVATAQELIERIRSMEPDDARPRRKTRGFDGA
jgi:hypothetical protein